MDGELLLVTWPSEAFEITTVFDIFVRRSNVLPEWTREVLGAEYDS